MECVDSSFLRLVDQAHFMAVLASLGAAFFLKDKKWTAFALAVSVFYFIPVYFHCEIKLMDPEFIWRYVIWTLNTCAASAVIYTLMKKELVYFKQALVFISLSVAEIALQAFRLVDIHFFNVEYSTLIYKSGMPTLNNLVVICCYLPLVIIGYRNIQKWIYRSH